MEKKEQLDQNPEMVENEAIKEEKPDVVTGATENQPVIEENEKKKIVELMKDGELDSDRKAEEKSASDEKKPEQKSSVNDEAQGVKEQSVVEQLISEQEKHRLIRLMSSNYNPQQPEGSYDAASLEEDEHHYDDLASHEYDIENMNKQELVELLEELVEEKDINRIKNQIIKIKSAFLQRNNEEIEQQKQRFIEAGNKEEDFKHTPDPLEVRYKAAFAKYKHNKAKFAEELEKQKQANLQEKLKVLEEMKRLIDSEETLKKTYDEFRKLQERWKEIGMVPAAEVSNLWESYHFYVDRFFDKVRINKELRDLDLKKNLEAKLALCEKTEELLLEKSILKSFKLLQQYHEEWRNIGPVPSDKKDDLWERFKAATDKINEKRKQYYKEIQDQQELNYQAKLGLCEKAEELVKELPSTIKEWQQKSDEINGLLEEWKKIGRAPRQVNDKIWARFKSSLDTFFEAKRAFFAKLKEQQMNNYNLKLDLCNQAEKLKDSTDWKKTTDELIRLQQEWKKIGPVPKRHSDKIWKRFRAACDEFFNRKAEYFKNIHQVEADNLKLKEALIKEIEAYQITNDRAKDLEAVKNFQRRWVEIGHVPYNKKDAVQSAYRAAIDKLFEKLSINSMEMTTANYKSHLQQLADSPNAESRLMKERNYLMGKMRHLKDEISVWENNIGFFANSKQSNALKQDFEKKINKAKREVEVLKAKIQSIEEMLEEL
jgi:hypothetical protein